jgi:hypothetical protein
MLTAQQLHLLNGLYLVVLAVVAVLTRATARRIAGALAGGAVMGVAGLGVVALGEWAGWWHWLFPWGPNFLAALLIQSALCAFVFLITWRVAQGRTGRCSRPATRLRACYIRRPPPREPAAELDRWAS